MLYWECKRRLVALRRFRALACDYFDNIQYASYMSGGAPVLNEQSQKARHEMNRVMGDVVISLKLFAIPLSVFYQPPPRIGGYSQTVDVIVNIFGLWEFQISPELVFDSVDRGIGAYERACEKLFRKIFNPFYWLGMLVVWVLRLPFKLLGAAGFDAARAEESLFGKAFKLFWGLAVGLATFIPAIWETADHWDKVRAFIDRCAAVFYHS